jgi:hypothetical protein
MFWMRTIRRLTGRIETLEHDYRKRLCEAGSHEWVMKTSNYTSDVFIGCKHCYAKNDEKKS